MKKILVVEDETDLRENICDLLESQNFNVKAAVDGYDAISAVKSFKPDLIISDVKMSPMDGFDLLKNLREDKNTDDIPFLFLTAKSDKDSFRRGMNLGADDYLFKPFNNHELRHAIDTRLNKKENRDKQIINHLENLSRHLPHELRNPLVPINGITDMLLQDFDSFEKSELLDLLKNLNNSSVKLQYNLNKLILFSELVLLIEKKKRGLQEFAETSIDPVERINKIITGSNKYNNLTFINLLDEEKELTNFSHYLFDNLIKTVYDYTAEKVITGSKINLSFSNEGEVFVISTSGSVEQETSGENQSEYSLKKLDEAGKGLTYSIIKKISEYYEGCTEEIYKENGYTLNIKLLLTNVNKSCEEHI